MATCPQCKTEIAETARMCANCNVDANSVDMICGVPTFNGSSIGQVISGRYVIEHKITGDAAGAAYLAEDVELNTLVLITALPVTLAANPQELDKLKQQTAGLSELSHPAIVALHAACFDEKIKFFVSDYVDGSSLAEQLSGNQSLSINEMVNIFWSIASAIDYAHSQDVIHGDIRPENFILGRRGFFELTNTAITHHIRNALTRINPAIASAKTAYLAPEQLSSGTSDRKSDIYSLAICIYQCLSGQRPLSAEKPEPLSKLNDHQNAALLRALSIDPQRRHDTAAELLTQLIASSIPQSSIDMLLKQKERQHLAQIAEMQQRIDAEAQARLKAEQSAKSSTEKLSQVTAETADLHNQAKALTQTIAELNASNTQAEKENAAQLAQLQEKIDAETQAKLKAEQLANTSAEQLSQAKAETADSHNQAEALTQIVAELKANGTNLQEKIDTEIQAKLKAEQSAKLSAEKLAQVTAETAQAHNQAEALTQTIAELKASNTQTAKENAAQLAQLQEKIEIETQARLKAEQLAESNTEQLFQAKSEATKSQEQANALSQNIKELKAEIEKTAKDSTAQIAKAQKQIEAETQARLKLQKKLSTLTATPTEPKSRSSSLKLKIAATVFIAAAAGIGAFLSADKYFQKTNTTESTNAGQNLQVANILAAPKNIAPAGETKIAEAGSQTKELTPTPAPAKEPDAEVKRLIAEAASYELNQQYKKAEMLYSVALTVKPNDEQLKAKHTASLYNLHLAEAIAAEQNNNLQTAIDAYTLALSYKRDSAVQSKLDSAKATLQTKLIDEQKHSQLNEWIILASNAEKKQDFTSAIQWHQKAAKAGDTNSKYKLAQAYSEGLGTAVDYSKTMHWLLAAVEDGSSLAMFDIASMYFDGHGVKQDYEKAIQWYNKAADAGEPRAMFNLGLVYQNGSGTAKDYAQAFHWFRKAADAGDQWAMSMLAQAYYNGKGTEKDYPAAAEWFLKAAEAGVSEAMYNIAVMFYDGQGVDKNTSKAMYWFIRSADEGNVIAMYKAGLAYCNAVGVAKNYRAGADWFKKAAEAGNIKAMLNLGVLYEDGAGIAKDYTAAIQWYQKAAEAGNTNAMVNLGLMHYNSRGTKQDYTTAAKWYETAANAGHIIGMYHLAQAYRQGSGIEKSYEHAAQWYKKAAEAGESKSMFCLGWAYANNEGLERNYPQAIQWYRRAAEANEKVAMYSLGLMYHTGTGIDKNIAQAIYWYQKSARLEYEPAKEKLLELGKTW